MKHVYIHIGRNIGRESSLKPNELVKVTLIPKTGTSVSANCVVIRPVKTDGIFCICDMCAVRKLYNTMGTSYDSLECPLSRDGRSLFCNDCILEDVDKIMEEI